MAAKLQVSFSFHVAVYRLLALLLHRHANAVSLTVSSLPAFFLLIAPGLVFIA